MGERQSDGGPAGRRRVHPEGTPPLQGGPGPVLGGHRVVTAADLETLLAAALIRDGVDAAAEQRAVAAFLAARETGALRARTRRRDDWRARRRRLGSHSLKATLSVVFAGLTLSGVAVAGIGAAGWSSDGPADEGEPTGVPSRSAAPSLTEPAGPGSGSGRPDRPGTAGDTEAHCRAYEKVEGRGQALEATAWKRLTEAAGGAADVEAYCAEQLGRASAEARPGDTRAPGAGKNGESGRAVNGSSGTASDNGSGNGGDNGSGNAGDNDSGNAGDNDSGNAGDNDSGNAGDNDSGNAGDNDSGNGGDNDSGNGGDNGSGNGGNDSGSNAGNGSDNGASGADNGSDSADSGAGDGEDGATADPEGKSVEPGARNP
ncbi:hypothetical protein FHS32_000991 [Streptomyces albaduncus]|uniref:Uncharacterized protein n=1 Tax=Streptomyces griseoloalbus TaxID=67303 RepID=A0A7W8F5T7_9ACTN|nr:hypothetical protein [Streptomyces albaduncus]MBB5124263.1 hypothetical protein [Streptomyces albaduncus]